MEDSNSIKCDFVYSVQIETGDSWFVNRFPSFSWDAAHGGSQETRTDRTGAAPVLDPAAKSQNRTAQTVPY